MTNRVKQVRQLRKMTLAELSKVSGVPISTINDIEQGAEPRLSTAFDIEDALQVDIHRLWRR